MCASDLCQKSLIAFRKEKMKVEVEINETKLGLQRVENLQEAYKALRDLYGMIWCEACYDPDNEIIEKYARRLLPLIQKANEILGFK